MVHASTQADLNTFHWFNTRVQVAILVILGLLFYSNSISNDYALDDGLVISDNPFALEGLGGIADIFSHDSYFGYYQKYGSNGELTGGRYRPLSIATYAIEYEFLGLNPHFSHAVNVFLYLLSIFVLYLLLSKYWFSRKPLLPFLITLLFAIHPLHTEVVANIKGRDEILSLLFLLLSLIGLFKFLNSGMLKKSSLVWSLLAYTLALFSKENGITFLAVIPLSLFVFAKKPLSESLKITLPFLMIAIGYLIIRFQIVGFGASKMDDVMNNPFILASVTQKFASIFFILLYYLRLLVFPSPLSYDYGFNTFPYRDFADLWVLFSVLIQSALLLYAIARIKKREPIAFAILFYFITLSIVSNLFVDLGGTMGERLIYHSSLGFVMLIALLTDKLFMRLNRFSPSFSKHLGGLLILLLIMSCGFQTISRNQDWKNNNTLFIHDVKAVPNSVKANVAASTAYISLADANDEMNANYLGKAETLLIHAKSIYPNFADIYMNLGGIYYRREQYDAAESAWLTGQQIQPNHPNLPQYFDLLGSVFYKQGMEAGAASDFINSVELLKKAAKYMPANAEVWYNLGGAQYSSHNYKSAGQSFEKAINIRPGYKEAQQGLDAVNFMLSNK